MQGIEPSRSGRGRLLVTFALLAIAMPATAETVELQAVAETTVAEEAMAWTPRVEYERLVLIVSGGGEVMRREFEAGEKPYLSLRGSDGQRLTDGGYNYELRVVPKVDPKMRQGLSPAGAAGRKATAHRRPESLAGPTTLSGHFVVHRGQFVIPGEEEEPEIGGRNDTPAPGRANPALALEPAAPAGTEAATYHRGSAATEAGEAVIRLPDSFAQVTDPVGLTVQVTPIRGWSRLYVVEKSPERLVVRSDGAADQEFDFLIQGVRKDHAANSAEPSAERR